MNSINEFIENNYNKRLHGKKIPCCPSLDNSRNSLENETFNLKNKMMMKEKRRLDLIFIGLMSFFKIGFIVPMNL